DTVVAQQRLPRVGSGARRAAVVHHRRRVAADDDLFDRGELPRCGALRSADCRRPAVPWARRSVVAELGHHALLVAERRCLAEWLSRMGHRTWYLCGLARRIIRAAQLRIRRDQQPGTAAGPEDTCQAHPFLRSRAFGSSTAPRAVPLLPSTTSTSTS